MKLTARWAGKWALRLLLLLLAVGALYVGIIVFPSPLFAHAETYGSYRVYSDEPIPGGFAATIEDLDRRLQAMEHAPREARQRIYLCGSSRFSFFATLLRMNPESLAIGLSVTNQSFVSRDRLRLFADLNQGRLRHTRFEGSIAEAVAHEIAHFHSVDALGYRAHLRQPVWKSEGWAEYQANLAVIRADADYDLARRINQLRDDSLWDGGHTDTARWLWQSQLLVEYLGEVEAYLLADLARDNITEAATRARMMAWYRDRAEH